MPQKTISFTPDTITNIDTAKKKFELEHNVTITFSAFVEKLVKESINTTVKN